MDFREETDRLDYEAMDSSSTITKELFLFSLDDALKQIRENYNHSLNPSASKLAQMRGWSALCRALEWYTGHNKIKFKKNSRWSYSEVSEHYRMLNQEIMRKSKLFKSLDTRARQKITAVHGDRTPTSEVQRVITTWRDSARRSEMTELLLTKSNDKCSSVSRKEYRSLCEFVQTECVVFAPFR